MMDNQVFLANGREAIAGMVSNAFGIAGIVRDEFKVRPIQTHELRQVGECQHSIDQENLIVPACQRLLHEPAQLHGHGRLELEPDDRAAPPTFENRLELANQVFRFLLDLDLGVANDAERTLAFDRIAGKEAGNEQADHLFERDHAGTRQSHETFDLVRHTDERVHRLAVAGARQMEGDGKAEIGDERERVRRVDGEGSEQGKNLPKKMIFQPGLLPLGHLRPLDQNDTLLGQHLSELAPALLLIPRQHPDGIPDADELFGGRQPVRALDRNSGTQLALEAGDAHHEELIEVVGGDREKTHPLEQGMGVIGGFLEHSAVEMQPRQLAVDEALRAYDQIDGRGFARGRSQWRDGFPFHNNGLASISHGQMLSDEERNIAVKGDRCMT
jgi:hypothetical protein